MRYRHERIPKRRSATEIQCAFLLGNSNSNRLKFLLALQRMQALLSKRELCAQNLLRNSNWRCKYGRVAQLPRVLRVRVACNCEFSSRCSGTCVLHSTLARACNAMAFRLERCAHLRDFRSRLSSRSFLTPGSDSGICAMRWLEAHCQKIDQQLRVLLLTHRAHTTAAKHELELLAKHSEANASATVFSKI